MVSLGLFNGDPAPPGPGDPQKRDASGINFRTDGGAFVIGELAYSASPSLFGDQVPGTNVAIVNALAHVANIEDHHPDLEVGYNYCHVTFTTHAIRGLSENDFVCAAKANLIPLA